MIHLLVMGRSYWALGMVALSACGARSGVELELEISNVLQGGVTVTAGAPTISVTNNGGASNSGGAASGEGTVNEDKCVPFPFTTIDDVEDGRIDESPAPGLALNWYADSLQGAAVQLGSETLFPPRGSSRIAMHARTDGSSLALGVRLSPCAHIGNPQAISFWARGSSSEVTFVRLESQDNTPASEGGWCYSTLCSPATAWVNLSSEWQHLVVPLASFAPKLPNGLEALRSVQLVLDVTPKSGPVELWMDDLEFLR